MWLNPEQEKVDNEKGLQVQEHICNVMLFENNMLLSFTTHMKQPITWGYLNVPGQKEQQGSQQCPSSKKRVVAKTSSPLMPSVFL